MAATWSAVPYAKPWPSRLWKPVSTSPGMPRAFATRARRQVLPVCPPDGYACANRAVGVARCLQFCGRPVTLSNMYHPSRTSVDPWSWLHLAYPRQFAMLTVQVGSALFSPASPHRNQRCASEDDQVGEQ